LFGGWIELILWWIDMDLMDPFALQLLFIGLMGLRHLLGAIYSPFLLILGIILQTIDI